MAGVITATQTSDPGAPQVGVTVSGLSATTPTNLVVDTSWDGGATWQSVRGGTVASALGSAFVRDYVAALNVQSTYRATATPPFVMRTNLLSNPKAGSGTSGWSASMGSGGVASTSASTTGALPAVGTSWFRALVTTAPTTSPSGIAVCGSGTAGAPVSPNTDYTASVYMYCTKAAPARVDIQWYNAAGALISTTSGSAPGIAAGAWERRSTTGTSPASAAYARPVVWFSVVLAVNDVMGASGAMVEAGTALGTYFDGATPGDGTFTYGWTGTADASSSNQYTSAITTTVTATSPYAWIQDPLNPRGAVALYRDMAGGHVLLTLGSLAGARWDQHADYATPIGSSLPVASLGVRQKAASVPMVLSYDVTLEGGRLLAMLESAGQLVVRGLPVIGLLDPVAHVTVAGGEEVRQGRLGQVSQWNLTARQVRPVSTRIVIPWWTYDDVKALVASQIGGTPTYDQVKAAQPAGKTYTQWVANPGVV